MERRWQVSFSPDTPTAIHLFDGAQPPIAPRAETLRIWKNEELSLPSGFCVYHLLRNGVVVYVGRSAQGMARVVSHIREQKKDFDSFRAYECATNEEAKYLEALEIWRFDPEYNSTGAGHPDYASAGWFYQIKWLGERSVKDYLASLPFILWRNHRLYHRKYKWPEGDPRRENFVGSAFGIDPESLTPNRGGAKQ